MYATASEKHHDYIESLGAKEVFDYKREDVVASIVHAAKADGVTIDYAYDAGGALPQIYEVLNCLKGVETAKVASAVTLHGNEPTVEGVDLVFVAASKDEKERDEMFSFVMNTWLKEKLASGEFVPSPKIEMVEGGLESLNKGLDKLKAGVSVPKIVLKV